MRGSDGHVLVADDLLARGEWLTRETLPRSPLPVLDVDAPRVGARLPVLYGAPTVGVDSVGVDVFGGAFFLLTRYEELVLDERDEHDRFPPGASIAAREGFLERPLANEYAELLWRTLERTWPRLERRPRAFRELPSHDVDWPLSRRTKPAAVLSATVRNAALDRDPALALRRLRAYGARRRGNLDADVNNTFELIMDASEARGLRSAFYFIAGRTAGVRDGVYDLDDPWVRGLLRRIHARGHELGLHPSYGTYDDAEQTRRELERLQRVCADEGIEQDSWGGRQHFLRWRNPVTWRNWDAAGLDYDSTLGYSTSAGFRTGSCYEHAVFDLEERRTLRVRERPLVVMEQAVLDEGDAAERIRRLRDVCRRFDGDFTLLWHNSRLLLGRERRVFEEAVARA